MNIQNGYPEDPDWTVWEPLACLDPEKEDTYALIKLNTSLDHNVDTFKALWKNASLRAVVDGGINTVYDHPALGRHDYVPDFISGDFDSARPEVLQYYRKQGVEVIETPDQDATDFTKCVMIMCDKLKTHQPQVSSIVAHVGFTGRFDHILGNLDTLYRARQLTARPVYLMSEASAMACLVPKGCHKIVVPLSRQGPWCGLVPVGAPCKCVTTTGLKYNLDHQAMSFGELISTSNEFNGSPFVTIETDAPLVWTMGIK